MVSEIKIKTAATDGGGTMGIISNVTTTAISSKVDGVTLKNHNRKNRIHPGAGEGKIITLDKTIINLNYGVPSYTLPLL